MSLKPGKGNGWATGLLAIALAALSSPAWAENQLLAAQTDDEFDRAERRVRLLCGD